MRIVNVTAGCSLLDTVYDELLLPAFPPGELVGRDYFRTPLEEGLAVVTAVVDDEGKPVAVAVGEWSPDQRVLLLAYLAVSAGERSRGLGSLLMAEVAHSWQQRFRPLLTLMEIEHPLAHKGGGAHGDPVARLRFYGRHGVRALDLPYFQPSLRPGNERVHGMLLAALVAAPEASGSRDGTVSSALVRSFLADYFSRAEGTPAADEQAHALWRAAERPGGIPLLPVDDLTALPLSAP